MRNKPSGNAMIVAARDQVSSDVGGEVVVVDLEAGMYYGLGEVEPSTVSDVRDAVLLDTKRLRVFSQGRHR
jgi:hypothetical protein